MEKRTEYEGLREGNVEREYERTSRKPRTGKRMADQSPDEVKASVKEKVSKGLAAVAGALEGFSEQVRKNDLPHTAQDALHEAGDTTRKVSRAARDEFDQTKSAVGRSGSGKKEPEEPAFQKQRPTRPSTRAISYESKTIDVHKEPSPPPGNPPHRRSPPGSGPSGRRL